MQPVIYDSSVIQEFANRLYEQARLIVFTSSMKGLVAGLIIGGIVGGAIQFFMLKAQHAPYSSSTPLSFDAIWISALVLATLGSISGYSRGREHSFKLRLEAQVALCHVQIEKNGSRQGS